VPTDEHDHSIADELHGTVSRHGSTSDGKARGNSQVPDTSHSGDEGRGTAISQSDDMRDRERSMTVGAF